MTYVPDHNAAAIVEIGVFRGYSRDAIKAIVENTFKIRLTRKEFEEAFAHQLAYGFEIVDLRLTAALIKAAMNGDVRAGQVAQGSAHQPNGTNGPLVDADKDVLAAKLDRLARAQAANNVTALRQRS